MNPEAEKLLGWVEEERLNQNLYDIIHRSEDGTFFSYEEIPEHKNH